VSAGLVVALLGVALLAWTFGPVAPSWAAPGPSAVTVATDRASGPALPTSPGAASAEPRPDGISATVLATISTENGTSRPEDHQYLGGTYPENITAWENRVFVIGDFSGNVMILNASTGGIVAAPDAFGCPSASAIDPVTGILYVADACREALYEVNPETGAILARLAMPGFPLALAYDPVHGLFAVATIPIANDDLVLGSLLFVNPLTGSVVGRHVIGTYPDVLALDPASNSVFVGNYWSANVSVVSTVSYALLATISGIAAPTGVSYDPANGEVYVATPGVNAVEVYDGATQATVTTVPLTPGTFSDELTYDSESQETVVVGYGAGPPVTLIEANNSIGGTFSFPSNQPAYVTYSAATNRLFISDLAENAILSCNATTGVPGPTTNLGTDPVEAAYDPTNGFLYVTNDGFNNLTVIDAATDQVFGSIVTGSYPYAIAYDPVDGFLYVTNPEASAVDIVNPTLGTLVGTTNVGEQPLSIVYDPVDHDLFVVNAETNNVSVLSGATGALLRTIGLGPHDYPFAATVDPTTGTVWLASELFVPSLQGNLTPINASTFATGPSVPLGGYSFEVSYDPGDGDLLVSEDLYDPGLTEWTALVSPTTGAVVENFSASVVLDGPAAWDAVGGFLAIPNYATDQLDALVGNPGTPLPLVGIGGGPYSTAVDPASGTVFSVNDYGSSVTVVAIASVPSDVAISTSPASCGAVTLNGTAETGYLSISEGIYVARAPSCYGYVFQGWSASGGVTVASPGTPSTNVTVLSNGTLIATFALLPGVAFGVGVTVSPASCAAAVQLAGSAVTPGAAVPLAAGSYPILAGACSGETFQSFETTGGVSFAPQGPAGGRLSVAGNGTVNASYLASSVSAPAPAPASSSGYSATELLAFVAAAAFAGALVGIVVGVVLGRRRASPPPPEPPAAPPPP
jgi:YVTN family beta-propeller protein